LILAASTALALAASSSAALAATGQVLCVGSPGQPITSAQNSAGQCKQNQTQVTVATESEVSALQGQVSTLQGHVSTLQSQVSALQSANTTLSGDVSTLKQTLSKVSYTSQGVNGQPTLTISGANLQVVNGTGQTWQDNGLGNLILGYDEYPGTQTGSHDLLLGWGQTFTSHGGIIGGRSNTLSGEASVVFGFGNVASGGVSAVLGGFGNTASGIEATVSGGDGNTASGNLASVSGGESNTASGFSSAILGGNGITVATTDGTSP
jgi:hypothetical protein